MCGIAGLYSPGTDKNSLKHYASCMMQALYHRGPDSGDAWYDSSLPLALTHRRLAIHDLSANGAQPMLSSSGRYCIVFNGEIYNYQIIKSDLDALGHSFRGHSDTEVMLAAVEEWGLEKSVLKFSGMFAFALWDIKEKVLHLCRDRLGEKPLYYGFLNGTFCFASELKSIEQLPGVNQKLQVNFQAAANYFKYGYIGEPLSIYKSIYKLRQGSILSLSLAQLNKFIGSDISLQDLENYQKSYWNPLDAANRGLANQIQDKQECASQLEELLKQVIKNQMLADVSVGTFLSGGVDSTLVSALAQSISSEKVKTYTLGFHEAEYDESPFAEKIAQHLQTEHHTLYLSAQDALKIIPHIASYYDEPFSDSSNIPTYIISKLAREHVTVCLSGDGGDELFAGYNRYISLQNIWQKISQIPSGVRKIAGKALSIPAPGIWDEMYGYLSSTRDIKSRKLIGLKIQKLASLMQKDDIDEAYDFLLSYWQDPAQIIHHKNAVNDNNKPSIFPSSSEFINKAMYWDQLSYLPGDNLVKVDRASMAVSLETRLPLLSYELYEYSWRIPLEFKVSGGTNKAILRNILYKYVPRELLERPKMGFSVPVNQWLRSELRDWSESLLNNITTDKFEFLDNALIMKTWGEHLKGKRDHSHRLWTVLMFLSWAENRNL